MRLALFSVALLLVGCVAPLRSVSTGEHAAPPPGYIAYCLERPEAVQCGGTR